MALVASLARFSSSPQMLMPATTTNRATKKTPWHEALGLFHFSTRKFKMAAIGVFG